MLTYAGLEIVVGWLFQNYKNGAWEYLYAGGMRWDPLGRIQDDEEEWKEEVDYYAELELESETGEDNFGF